MKWHIKTFKALSKEELYAILALRNTIFIVEQACVYQDIDGLDSKAIHLFLTEADTIIAYARLFNPNHYYDGYTSIGRVLVSKSHRKKGLAHKLLEQAITYLSIKHPKTSIKIGAQMYLKTFYESHDFHQIGKSYIEDGIPHIYMLRPC